MKPQQHLWNIGVLVGALLAILIAVIAVKELKSIAYVGKSDQIVNAITVSGKGEVVAIPDVATFSFSVTETAATVADAQIKSTTKITGALKALKDAGIVDKDVKTSSYSINPHYEYQEGVCTQSYPSTCKPGKSVLTGYDVGQTIEVKVRDLAKAGAIFGSIGSLGVQNVNGLSFSIDNPDMLKDQARSKAIAEAQQKALTLAQQLGVSLVRITNFNESGDQAYPIMYGLGGGMMDAKVASAPTPQIPTGDQKVTSNVSVTYEIE